MLLRSSSTPVLGSLLSSLSETPNHKYNHHHQQPEVVPHTTNKHPTTTVHSHNKVSFNQPGCQNFTTFSCNSSPMAISEFSGTGRSTANAFRRAQSEGNLEGLANASTNVDEFSISKPPKKFSRRPHNPSLQTIPSFSSHNSTNSREYEDNEGEERKESEMRYVNAYGYGNVGLEEAIGGVSVSPHMYLARGLGVAEVDIGFGGGCGPNGGGGCGSSSDGCSGDGDGVNLEEHYKNMVGANPGNPLFLRNYAQFLYESKGDLEGAEEYYSRAILADPKDGEILSQYAKLVWELRHDEDRALSYFERAVQAASEDSHVHAAYASFLWQIEEDEIEDDVASVVPTFLHRGAMASPAAA